MKKKSSVFCSFLLGCMAVGFTACSGESCNGTAGEQRTAVDVIHERTSIRSFRDRPVTKEQLEKIVRAGMAAPSAMNKQPWQFIMIDEKEKLTALGGNLSTGKMTAQAAAAIVVCGDLSKAGEGITQEYWIQDCSAATQNILLAITDMGLGAVWVGIYPLEDRIRMVSELLELPEHVIPLCVIPLGYSAEDKKPMDKWKPENVHWNGW